MNKLLKADSSSEDGVSGCLSYKKLYHASVERSSNLQEQLEKCSELLSKHRKIAELKNKAVSSLSKNKDLVDSYHRCLVQEKNEWRGKLDESLLREKKWEQEFKQLQEKYEAKELECSRNYISVCSGLMAKVAIARAESRIKDRLLEDAATRKKTEIEKAKKKFSSYAQSLMLKYTTVKESLEFSEAERETLVDSNTELESQLKLLTTQLEERTSSLQQAKAERTAQPSPPPAPPTLSLPTTVPTSSCGQCTELSKQLGVAIKSLNNRGCAKYGDLLHSNFTLEQKLNSVLQEHQRLVDYNQEYKERSMEKVGILKENIEKADREIAELDKLMEMVREAMHCSMHLVKQSPHLLRALEEIDGT